MAIDKTIYGTPLTQETVELYWCVYKNLEKEVIALTDVISFDDTQMNVYSIRIAELILRIAAEIESLCKDLYETLALPHPNNGFKFDFHCIKAFNERWGIESKVVTIVHPLVRFSQKDIYPFKNATNGTAEKCTSNIWKFANNEVKHNLRNCLKSATIRALVEGMAALYLLNVYSRYQQHPQGLQSRTAAELFDPTLGSDLFKVGVQRVLDVHGDADRFEMLAVEPDLKSVFRIIPTNDALKCMRDLLKRVSSDAIIYFRSRAFEQDGDVLAVRIQQDRINRLSSEARMYALHKHAGEFSKVIETMSYQVSLIENASCAH